MKIENQKKPWSFFKTITFYYIKNWKFTIVMILLMTLITAGTVMLPLITYQMNIAVSALLMHKDNSQSSAEIFEYAKDFWFLQSLKNGNFNAYLYLIYMAVPIIVMYCLLSFLYDYFVYLMGRKIEIDLRNKVLESLVRKDISYYSDKKLGEILTKVVSDTQIVGDQAVQIPIQVGISLFEIAASITMMFVFAYELAAVATVAFVIIMIIMTLTYKLTQKKYNVVREVITDINGDVTDRLATVRLIKSSGTEDYETDRFYEIHKKYYKKSETIARIQSSLLTTMYGGIYLLQFSTIIGALLIYSNYSDPQTGLSFFQTKYAAFTLAQSILISPIIAIMSSSFGLATASVASRRVNQIIISKSLFNSHNSDGEIIESISGDINFKNITFNYPEKPEKLVLPKFDFTFKNGKSYAFVGATGSGKSTIAKLLLRFYDPTSGDVYINNNINLKDINLPSYLNHVGYVEQDPQILYGDVYENVKYGKFNATNEEVIEACLKADLHNLVQSWPDGYNTILGERGFMLSGGQKQRLVIARMFLKDPKILILDEATSALDNIVEAEIQQELDKLMEGRTTVSIAHRLSTIKNVDEIIVLGPNGKGIIQRGSFDELLKVEGHFKELYEAG